MTVTTDVLSHATARGNKKERAGKPAKIERRQSAPQLISGQLQAATSNSAVSIRVVTAGEHWRHIGLMYVDLGRQ